MGKTQQPSKAELLERFLNPPDAMKMINQLMAHAACLVAAAPELMAYAERTEKLIAWAVEHGADKIQMARLDLMRQHALSQAKYIVIIDD